jgi:FlaA1/EpsC-like NDP-sugar epimerase
MGSGKAPEALPRSSAIPAMFTVGMIIADSLVAVAALGLAYIARFDGYIPLMFATQVYRAALVGAVIVPVVFVLFGLYGFVWRYVGVEMVLRVAGAVTVVAVFGVAIDVMLSMPASRPVPLGVIAIAATFLFVGATALRAVSRLGVYVRARGGSAVGRRVLIVGAGDAGSLLLRDIENAPTSGVVVVGLLDDDTAKVGRLVRNARVIGTIDELPRIADQQGIDEVLVALPSVSAEQRARVLDLCAESHVPVKLVPSMVTAAGTVGLDTLRRVEIADLLGREPVPVDVEGIRATIGGRVVAVTGAAGSIGAELCRQILSLGPSRLLMIELDESRLYEVYCELEPEHSGVPVMRICDIRDKRKLVEVFSQWRPELVFHAAAYKHVPLMEIEPDEAVKTNVLGTRNVVRACIDSGVGAFILISTDKAVNAQSVMGLSKAIAERITLDAARHGLRAACVRFGNVLGSRGSVVPLFEEQLRRGGPLKVTHPDVTRYFMTIPEAARLVLQAQALTEGGDIFVLEMGEPVKIVDLAQKMITLSGVNTTIEFTGLRPAEKLHEVLIHGDEDLAPTSACKVQSVTALPVPAGDLNLMLDTLGEAAARNDRTGMKSAFAAIMPSFAGWSSDFADDLNDSALQPVVDSDMETLL